MKRLAALALAAALLVAPAVAWAADAVETVKGFYIPTIWNPLESEDYSSITEPALTQFKRNAAQSVKEEGVGCIDFVLTVDGQDYDEATIQTSLKLKDTGTGTDGATVVSARFMNFETPTEILWTMREEGGAWKVSDIQSTTSEFKWKLSDFACE